MRTKKLFFFLGICLELKDFPNEKCTFRNDLITRLNNTQMMHDISNNLNELTYEDTKILFERLLGEYENLSVCLNECFPLTHCNSNVARIINDDLNPFQRAFEMKLINFDSSYKDKSRKLGFIPFTEEHMIVNEFAIKYENILDNIYSKIQSLEFKFVASRTISDIYFGNLVKSIVRQRNYKNYKSIEQPSNILLMRHLTTNQIIEFINLDFLFIDNECDGKLNAYSKLGKLKFKLIFSNDTNNDESEKSQQTFIKSNDKKQFGKASGNIFSNNTTPFWKNRNAQNIIKLAFDNKNLPFDKKIKFLHCKEIENEHLLDSNFVDDIFNHKISAIDIKQICNHFNHKLVITSSETIDNNKYFLIAYEIFLSNINTNDLMEQFSIDRWNNSKPLELCSKNHRFNITDVNNQIKFTCKLIHSMYSDNPNYIPITYKPAHYLNLGEYFEGLDRNILNKGYNQNKYIFHTIDRSNQYECLLLDCADFLAFQYMINKSPNEVKSFFYHDIKRSVLEISFDKNEIYIYEFAFEVYKYKTHTRFYYKLVNEINNVYVQYTGCKYSIFAIKCNVKSTNMYGNIKKRIDDPIPSYKQLIVDTENHRALIFDLEEPPLEFDESQFYLAKGICVRLAKDRFFFTHIDPIKEKFFDYLFDQN